MSTLTLLASAFKDDRQFLLSHSSRIRNTLIFFYVQRPREVVACSVRVRYHFDGDAVDQGAFEPTVRRRTQRFTHSTPFPHTPTHVPWATFSTDEVPAEL